MGGDTARIYYMECRGVSGNTGVAAPEKPIRRKDALGLRGQVGPRQRETFTQGFED